MPFTGDNMINSLTRLFLALVLLAPMVGANGWDRTRATVFGVLPEGAVNPEGITADEHGNIYVTTFGVTSSGPGHLVVFERHGDLIRDVRVANSSNLLLGLAFHPMTRELLVLDFGGGKVWRVNPETGDSTLFFAPNAMGTGLNALTFDDAGHVYVSDSFLGIIWRSDAAGGNVIPWVNDPLLRTTGYPPFGANGLNFNNAKTKLFVANTGDDTVVQIPFDRVTHSPGMPSVFVNGINGADGLIVDRDDNLWVAANQADEIVVVDPMGMAIAKLGDFNGIDRQGRPNGLLFPASLVFSGEFLYVTNLSLDLRLFMLPPSVDSEWCAQVRRFTVSKIRAQLPRGDDKDQEE